MNRLRTTLPWLFVISFALVLASCLIIEVEQPTSATQGEVITVNVTLVDSVADQNAWKGVLSVLVPDDWELISGEYTGDLGAGTLDIDAGWADSTEAILPAPAGMKWVAMLSDKAYAYPTAPITMSAAIQLKVGQRTGDFDIGYFTTKNAFNVADLTTGGLFRDAADTTMNVPITVIPRTAIEDVLKDGLPTQMVLEQNYPNPFNPSTTIRYAVEKPARVTLGVYDTAGRQVASLDQGFRGQGVYEVQFDGSGLASGVYLYRLQAGSKVVTRSMVLTK